MPCGNREKDKYLERNRDLTAPREAGLPKVWAWDAGFLRLLGIREMAIIQTNVLPTKAAGVSFQTQVCLVNNYLIETVREYFFFQSDTRKVYVM